jgi:hypothetical protein
MAGDYGDTSGGNSDQAIRDIVAQLQSNGLPAAQDAPAASLGVMPAPEVTPAMSVMLPSAPQAAPAAPSSPNGFRTMQIGDYAMPQLGSPSQYDTPVSNAPAAGPTSTGGAPLAGTSAQWTASAPGGAPSAVPGPGGYSAADRFNKFSLPAGGGPLSVADAQKVIDSYESTGGHAFAPATNGTYARRPAAGDDWVPPSATMVAPTVTPLGTMAAMPQRTAARVATMGGVLGR